MKLAPTPLDGATDADTRAESIMLPQVDHASAVMGLSNPHTLHSDDEYGELRTEQERLWDADGIAASSPPRAEAAGLNLAAITDARIVTGREELADIAREQYARAIRALTPFVRRSPKATIPHLLTKVGLYMGEGAGIIGAALLSGEVVLIAIIMGISVATATLVAGFSGAEFRELRSRALRQRDPDMLTEGQRAYLHLFTGPSSGWVYVKALLWVSGAIAGTLAVAIMALRSVVEDPLVGIVFGMIAAAVAAASWVDSFMYADAVMDVLEASESASKKADADARKAAESPPWRRQAEAQIATTDLREEHTERGNAAAAHMEALRYRIRRLNPAVAGHGRAHEAAPIGQTTRRGGSK
jgi:hypothetical protein